MAQSFAQLPTTGHDRRQTKRRQVDELLALAEYLPRDQRILIEQTLGQGVPVARVARLYQRPARQLRRQVHAIVKRLSNKLFKYVAIQIDTLPPEARATARHVVLHGKSLRETARITGLSLHRVRQHMNTVQATARLLA